MPLATDVEVCGTDGVWRVHNMAAALRARGIRRMRCVAYSGHVKLHDAARDGSQAAHVEHVTRWAGCARSYEYDGGGTRPHPNRVPD